MNEILEDIIYLLFLIFIIIILSLMLNSWMSFFLLILSCLVFVIKFVITKEKLNSLSLNNRINNINETNIAENQLLSYSNDISKIKLSTRKDNIDDNDKFKDGLYTEKEIDTEEKSEIREEFIEKDVNSKEDSVDNSNSNSISNLETVKNDNTSVEESEKEEDDKYSLTDEELKKCIRKLGNGRKASDKAIALAKKYGYELKDGETFISPKKG